MLIRDTKMMKKRRVELMTTCLFSHVVNCASRVAAIYTSLFQLNRAVQRWLVLSARNRDYGSTEYARNG